MRKRSAATSITLKRTDRASYLLTVKADDSFRPTALKACSAIQLPLTQTHTHTLLKYRRVKVFKDNGTDKALKSSYLQPISRFSQGQFEISSHLIAF